MFEKLHYSELLLLQKHIKLGKGHLKQSLSQEELDHIFQLATLPSETEQKLSVNKTEIIGQTSMTFNTMLTSVLAAWMGVSGFLNWSLGSKPLFFAVLLLSLFLGALIGVQSGLLKRKIANQVLDKRKLQDIEMAIVNEMNQNMREKLRIKTEEFVAILSHFKIDVDREEVEKSKGWLRELRQKISEMDQETPLHAYFVSELVKFEQDFTEERDVDRKEWKKILKKLSHSSSLPQMNLKSWIHTNFNRLLVELIPTVFGTVGSLLVYLRGAPAVAEDMGKKSLLYFLSLPEVRLAQLSFALLVTLYFGFVFFYLNKKAYKRDQEIAQKQAHLTREENLMATLDRKLFSISEWLKILHPLFRAGDFGSISRSR